MIHEKIYLKQSIISQLRNYHVSKQLDVVHDSVIGWLLVNSKNMNLYTNPTSQVAEKLQPSQIITLSEAKQIGPGSVWQHLYDS